MNLINCKRSDLIQRIEQRHADPAAVEACVVACAGEAITVDIDHPAYPHQCATCQGPHATSKCPIPPAYDGDYRKDSGGSYGCNCA